MRIILSYAKLGPMAFIAHLDFQMLLRKVFQLAGLKLEYSKGFNPRPKMRFAAPLATGFQGQRELVEIYLEQEADDIAAKLNKILPPGLQILGATVVDQDFPKVTALAAAQGYKIELPVAQRIVECAADQAGEYLLAASQTARELHLLLKVIAQKTPRPDKLAAACLQEFPPTAFAITRTGFYADKKLLTGPAPHGLLLLPSP